MVYKPSRVHYYWRATLDNGRTFWFHHSTGKAAAYVPSIRRPTALNNNSINAFLNRVALNTNQGVHWNAFVVRR